MPDTKPAPHVMPNIPSDMIFYTALAGKQPRIEPAESDPVSMAALARRENPWSPVLLSTYLTQICRHQANRLNRPEISAWVKKQTVIARRRFQQTQTRLQLHRRKGLVMGEELRKAS